MEELVGACTVLCLHFWMKLDVHMIDVQVIFTFLKQNVHVLQHRYYVYAKPTDLNGFWEPNVVLLVNTYLG